MKKTEFINESTSNSTINSTQSIAKMRRSQSSLMKQQNNSHIRMDQINQNIDLELTHVNNLDLWKINTQKQLRDTNNYERRRLVYPSTLIEKTDPLIKVDIINNIIEQQKFYRQYQCNKSEIRKEISSMHNLGSSVNISRRESQDNRTAQALLAQGQSSDKNKVVISKIVLNKFQQIYDQEKNLDQHKLLQERPRIDNTLKNFKSLQMTLSSSGINLNEIQKKITSIQQQPKKLFDFSEEMKRIESEKLDFVNCERKILQKMYQLQYNIKIIRECKKQVRSHIFDLSQKLSLFNIKIILSKYERLERNLVIGYFQERKKGDSSKFNIMQIKDKLKFDDVFLGYLEKLKEMKQKEVDEYSDAKQQITYVKIVLQQQFEYLKNQSQEIKENYVKCKMQLRDMLIDLFTTHLKTFLQYINHILISNYIYLLMLSTLFKRTTQNLSWIVRGFIMLDESLPIQKLPRYLDDDSIEYALKSGQILYDIQLLEEKKPQIFTKYNQESENVNLVLRELAEKLNGIPLLNDKPQSFQNIPLVQAQNEQENNLNGKISFQIPDLDDEILNEGIGNFSEISSNKHSTTYSHYSQLRRQTSIQKLLTTQSQNMLGTDQIFFAEDFYEKKFDFNTIDKKVKEMRSQLSVLKRKEIYRLIELFNTKQIKEDNFQDTISILFGYNEKDRVLREFFQKKQRNEYIQQEKQMQNPFYQMQQKQQLMRQAKISENSPTPTTSTNKQQVQNFTSTIKGSMFHRSQSIPTLKDSMKLTTSYKNKVVETLQKEKKEGINISTYNFLEARRK